MNKSIDTIIANAGPILVSLDVSFGPAFSKDNLTNIEFIKVLREEGSKHKSWVGHMMKHFADHIENGISSQEIDPNGEADTDPNTTYYGQGSCTGCPGDDGSGANCCLCVYNGQNVGCDAC